MKKKTVCCSVLGAYINELLKRAKLKMSMYARPWVWDMMF